jgi:hypothetical protein
VRRRITVAVAAALVLTGALALALTMDGRDSSKPSSDRSHETPQPPALPTAGERAVPENTATTSALPPAPSSGARPPSGEHPSAAGAGPPPLPRSSSRAPSRKGCNPSYEGPSGVVGEPVDDPCKASRRR